MTQKKLLLLGGSRYLIPVIEAAHKLGCYVITCDYLPYNIAHKYADEYCNVSIVDKDAVLKKARELDIDGIMSFACDPGVVTAAYVAEKMNLPSVGSYESVSILQNKGKFRKFLSDNGFNVPKANNYRKVEEALAKAEELTFPVIVKPTDSAGSKGVSKVEKAEDLTAAIEYALKNSISGEYIIEDFLTPVGYASDCDCFTIDGKIVFMTFSSQRFDPNSDNPYTPAAYSWPSSISLKHREYLKAEIQRLVTLLGLKTSIFNFETRECTDGKAYIMELSPRGGGNRLAEMVRYGTGVDMIEGAVKAAVGLEVTDVKQADFDKCWAELILHSNKDGEFKCVESSAEITKNIVDTDIWITEGSHVEGFSGANKALGTLILSFDDQAEMEKIMRDPYKYVNVKVE